ncbi:AAA family ATPase [Methanorbis furvi]|uniref:Endonuclease GajA/Old nuclease/RecF-like AAA domain-containing protein n=1 Tax=Methanorbis furvi TaxID=3028299 RepID=A0AAE4MDV3_9EURY|nr:hypothetical protein [Methanocorpusculaceae archaeon Ag1]
MRITKILISNYRQHKNIEVEFKKRGENDLHLFIAKNGVGKTNTLNAIYWCLYNEEPYLSIKNQSMPILNKACWNSGKRQETVSVEIHIQNPTNKETIIIKRTQNFDLTASNPTSPSMRVPRPENSKLSVFQSFGGANPWEIEDTESTNNLISRFVPKEISEYFLFDGERLDNYFRDSSGGKIETAIARISKLDQLDDMRRRLDTLQTEFRKQIKGGNLSIENLGEIRDDFKNKLEENERKRTQTKEIIEDHKKRLQELSSELIHTPDIKKIEADLLKVDMDITSISSAQSIDQKTKSDKVYEYFIKWQFYQPMILLKSEINRKRQTKEIPVVQNKDVVEEIKRLHHCSICGRELDSNSEIFIDNLLKSYTMSTTTSSELLGIDWLLGNTIREFQESFPDKLDEITERINRHEEQLSSADARKGELSFSIKNYSDGKVRKLQEEREDRETAKYNAVRTLGSLDSEIDRLKIEFDKAERNLDRETSKVDKKNRSKQSYEICGEAIRILDKSRENILNDIRNDIQTETNTAFFKMIWKKSTFKEIKIEKDYSVMLYDMNDVPVLGSISKAENELLALAFTMALHKVSGFEAPIIIDTPVARISSEQRAAFGRALADVSKDKQMILLFTPDEYSDNIREVIEPIASQKYTYELSPDEAETRLITVGEI